MRWQVRSVPTRKSTASLDHLVGAREQRRRHHISTVHDDYGWLHRRPLMAIVISPSDSDINCNSFPCEASRGMRSNSLVRYV
jgi:hypothetical protein